MPKNIFKQLKTKDRYEISNIKLVLKSYKNLAVNYFIKIIFPKFDTFLYVSAGQNTILTKPKEQVSYKNPI